MVGKKDSPKPKHAGTAGRTRQTESAPRTEGVLSLQRIVAAAVDLLDAEGLGTLSMRKLAANLGCGAMSLYWHVDDKDKVLDLALDHVLATAPSAPMPSTDNWKPALIDHLQDWRAAMLRHPWSIPLLPQRALGPSMLARLESISKTLSAAGLRTEALNPAIWSLWNYVIGATITRANFFDAEPDRIVALATLSDHYPHIVASGLLMDEDWDGAFEKGLNFLLAGLPYQKQETY